MKLNNFLHNNYYAPLKIKNRILDSFFTSSILFGCEMLPFTETTINAIDSIQAGVAKFALNLTCSTPNYCAQSELGLKPFRQVQVIMLQRLLSLSWELQGCQSGT